jgi:hypothetical protein
MESWPHDDLKEAGVSPPNPRSATRTADGLGARIEQRLWSGPEMLIVNSDGTKFDPVLQMLKIPRVSLINLIFYFIKLEGHSENCIMQATPDP